MLQSLGFGSVSTDVLWAALLCLMVLALVVGFVSDSILGAVGFGLFGNSLLAFAGSLAALVALVRYGWEWVRPDVVSTSVTSLVGAFACVLLAAVLRRLVT